MPATVNERSGWNAAVEALEEMAKAMGEKADAARSPNPFDPATMEEADAATSGWVLAQAAKLLRERTPAVSPAPVGEAVAWRCFHCDDVFTLERDARLHFGGDEGATPACQIKGSERGLVAALRRAENDASEAWKAIHDETTDVARAYHAQAARHRQQLTTIEQVGYDRGIADAKANPETLGLYARPVEEPASLDDDALSCFVCNVPFKSDDICADDINEGSAHAACLEGSAIVDLETGEPSDGPIATWRYGDRA